MADYIDRNAMLEQIERRERMMSGDKTISVDALKQFVLNRPAEDVVRVVRCKDCICADADPRRENRWWCRAHMGIVYEDEFCSRAERKEENKNE